MVLDKKELDRSIHLLEGILKGIAFDQKINEKEIDELNHWILSHEQFRKHYPYTVLIPLLSTVLADKIITEDEKQDILWFCEKVSTDNFFYDLVYSDLQRLQGIIHGILSDKLIRDEEIIALEHWLLENRHLESHYPYDELVAIVGGILEDKKITERERRILERYFIEFINEELLSAYSPEELKAIRGKITIGAVCAKNPQIQLHDKIFAITGQITRHEKNRFIENIKAGGGCYSQVISDRVDYLIVMDTGALLWAFEPYGRKINQALNLRSEGRSLMIIQKKDMLQHLTNL